MNIKSRLPFSSVWALGVLVAFLSVSCQTQNNVVSKGVFQKRKYNKGYHTNLHWGKKKQDRIEAKREKVRLEETNRSEIALQTPSHPTEPVSKKAERKIQNPDLKAGNKLGLILSKTNRKPTKEADPMALNDADKQSSKTKRKGKKLSYLFKKDPNRVLNGLALAGFILSILSIIPPLAIFSILGIIFGSVAKGQMRREPERYTFASLDFANIAIIVGLIVIAIYVLIIVLLIAILVGGGSFG